MRGGWSIKQMTMGDVLKELACTDGFEEHCELTAESEQEEEHVEDKVCWADDTEEHEFSDDRTGRSSWTQWKSGLPERRSWKSWRDSCSSRRTWRSAFG